MLAVMSDTVVANKAKHTLLCLTVCVHNLFYYYCGHGQANSRFSPLYERAEKKHLMLFSLTIER